MVNPLRYVAFMVTFVGHCTVLQFIQYLPFFTVRPFSIETFRKFNRFVMDSWVSTIVWVTSIFAYAAAAPPCGPLGEPHLPLR